MRPTQALSQRLKTRYRFTTKDVGRGFYRGSGVGSLGAHTPKGGYVIDYRKTRHFIVPDLLSCKLDPYINAEIHFAYTRDRYVDGEKYGEKQTSEEASKITREAYLKQWFAESPAEIDWEYRTRDYEVQMAKQARIQAGEQQGEVEAIAEPETVRIRQD